jgi:hypothetical protein
MGVNVSVDSTSETVADIFLDTSYLETLEAKTLLETPLLWGFKLCQMKRIGKVMKCEAAK